MATLPTDLLALLADPETHEALSLASPAQLDGLKRALGTGKARRRDGKAVPADFDAALLRSGGRVAYLVQGAIPNLLVDERIELEQPL
jgi:uncharacterized protein YbaR (Trm112 family)